jgi:hypothetical protein
VRKAFHAFKEENQDFYEKAFHYCVSLTGGGVDWRWRSELILREDKKGEKR